MERSEKSELAILLFASFFLGVYLYYYTYVISLDGAFQYIPLAKDFASGLYRKALGHGQQPLYSILTALLSFGIPDFEVSGRLISTFSGIFLVIPAYALGKRILGRPVAFYSVLFLVIHPYVRRYSADVLKESTYLFFFAAAIWFSWTVLEGKKLYPYLVIPILSAFSYLVRPDGVEVLFAVIVCVLLLKEFPSHRRRWTALLFLLIASGVIFLPYLLQVKWATGIWALSKAKGLEGFLGLQESRGGISLWSKLLYSLKALNLEILAVYHPVYLFLLLIGLWGSIKSRLMPGERFLLLLVFLHYVVSFLMVFNLTEWNQDGSVHMSYFSGRHVLPLLVVSIYWVGRGFLTLFDWLAERIKRLIFFGGPPSLKQSAAVCVLFALMAAMILPKTLKPQRYERLSEKWAGTWIKNQPGGKKTILTSLPRIAYYGEGNLVFITSETPTKSQGGGACRDEVYLAVREGETFSLGDGPHEWKQGFTEAHRFGGKGVETIVVYRKNR
jgi:hypothetical protein